MPALDVSVLKRLVGDDDATVREFLAEFLAAAREQAAGIAAACAAHDVHRVAGIAHKLKASSRSVGALALGERCAELERAGNLGLTDLAAQCLRFEAAMHAVDARIVGLLAASAA